MAPSKTRLRLHPHAVNSLPPHPYLASTISAQSRGTVPPNPEYLLQYAQALLTEAVEFTDSYLPRKFRPKATKASPPSAAKVQLLSHTRNALHGEETWFARRSVHASTATNGTASFPEFDAGLRNNHSVHEMAYTPDVYDAFEVLSWDNDIPQRQTSAQPPETNGPTSNASSPPPPPIFSHISLRIYEMCHALPAPLQPRSFPVLVASAKTHSPYPSSSYPNTDGTHDEGETPQDGFIIAQIPIDIASVPAALYSNSRNVTEGTSPEKRRPVVVGGYCSVERCRIISEGRGDGQKKSQPQRRYQPSQQPGGSGREEVEWVMATASDARGVLPMWVQKMGTPGAVVKDVGLFLGWVQGRRGS